MANKDLRFVITSFFTWKILLFVFLLLALKYLPLQPDFLGGGSGNYERNPYFWAWLNFDGEHYLSLAQNGYLPLTYFYFPVYPIMIKLVSVFIGKELLDYALSGLFISHLALLIGLCGLIKLVKEDYGEKIATLTVVLLLLFPTSFYFASVYTESLFFALVVWTFYFLKKKIWILAGLLTGISTATRLVGLALMAALLVEIWLEIKGKKVKIREVLNKLDKRMIIGIIFAPLGFLCYIIYLKFQTGDFLEFIHTITIFGQQRSSEPVLLLQVFYRYIFKILPSINYNYFPVVYSTILEFVVALLFLVVSILSFIKLRLSYAVYLTLGYMMPTLSGSFSSLPRYTLVLFPAFLIMSLYLIKLNPALKILVFTILFICLGIATSFFVRGLWIS